ncbi:MAG: hypothetical protein ACSLFR_07065 [Solirubrobacteraceae bacterium]
MRAARRIGVALAVGCLAPVPAAGAAEMDCSRRSEGQFPGAGTAAANLRVGPLTMVGWHTGASAVFIAVVDRPLYWKMPLLLRDGRRVTVRIAASARSRARLRYDTRIAGDADVTDHPAQITFTACSRKKGERGGSSVDGTPVTFWSGGVVFENTPACVPIQFRHDGSKAWRTRTLKLATTDC